VCRHHDSLCDISDFVNRTYSFQILLSVTVTCTEVLFTTHSVSSEFSYINMLQYFSSTKFLSMITIVWMFALTANVVQLVVVCNRASWAPFVVSQCFLSEHVANRMKFL